MASYRKKTYLEGIYKTLTPPDLSGKILVTELSTDGCCFSASLLHHLHPNDHIGIAFSLNDARNSMVRKTAVILTVDGRTIDCQFLNQTGAYDPALGFYLRNS